jgi:hypothetical protein
MGALVPMEITPPVFSVAARKLAGKDAGQHQWLAPAVPTSLQLSLLDQGLHPYRCSAQLCRVCSVETFERRVACTVVS